MTDPDGDTQTFAFTGDLAGSIADNGSIGDKSVAPGSYTTTETVPDGWDLNGIDLRRTPTARDRRARPRPTRSPPVRT